MSRSRKTLALLLLAPLAMVGASRLAGRPVVDVPIEQQEQARVAWTTSKVKGSPEPPLPYRLEHAFPKLGFQKLTHLAFAPGMTRLFVTTELGKIYSFPPDDKVAKADLFLDVPKEVKAGQPGKGITGFETLFSIVFHPKFEENRYCYICYVVHGNQAEGKSPFRNRQRLVRLVVPKADPPRPDLASEKVILEWPTERGGHNGCDLCFGPDGYLYISMGDAGPASPPDKHMTGQDLSDLLACIMRIDVDHADGDKNYKVPADNPFVSTPGARPEIWAYGLRNPWKMSFDKVTGDLWVGDVGWEMWEMVYRVRKGGNYGWSIVEGPQQVHPNAKRGPTPILPPTLTFSHAEAASITGGFVYRGKRYPDLVGTYLCGDWMTRKIWSTRFDGDRIVSHKEIVNSNVKIVGFGQDHDGELYVLGYGDTLDGVYRIVPNKAKETAAAFPRKLSETGLFTSTNPAKAAPGVQPYSIHAEPWLDHATAERLVALPGESSVKYHANPIPVPNTAYFKSRIFFPKDAVLAKTISMEMERGKASSKKKLETQLLHFDGDNWQAYTYRWNGAQTDADLVPASGVEMELDIIDADAPGGKRKQTWHFASRAQCLVCHNGWVGPQLGFTPEQLNRGEQIEQLQKLKILSANAGDGKIKPRFTQADPYDGKQPLATRARSYLDVNCAHCHQNGAGGTATIDLRASIQLSNARALDVTPVQGGFNMSDAKLLASGDPYRSVIYYRIAKTGPGRMPHIGSDLVDSQGVELIHEWIRSLPTKASAKEVTPVQLAFESLVAQKGEGDLTNSLNELLSSTAGSLMLARALDKKQIPANSQSKIVAHAMAKADGITRDLFERFLPADQRVKRLGATIVPQTLLALKGDADRGRTVFFKTAGVQCAICHKVGGVGGDAGPDLSLIGKKYDRAKILENILDPSKDIEPKYIAHLVNFKDGRSLTGLIVSRDAKEIVLRDAQAKEHRVAAGDVENVVMQRQSLMPEQLLRELTAQQAVDLLDFLASLKGP